jgi:uncharacterized protein YjbI with pentapeptide repeats
MKWLNFIQILLWQSIIWLGQFWWANLKWLILWGGIIIVLYVFKAPNKFLKTLWKKVRLFKRDDEWLQVLTVAVFIAFWVPLFHLAFWPGGAGFESSVAVTNIDKGRTVWDWLKLLGVPVSLAILGFWFQRLQNKRSESFQRESQDLYRKFTEEQNALSRKSQHEVQSLVNRYAKEQNTRSESFQRESQDLYRKFTEEQNKRTNEIAERQLKIAEAENRENALQAYFDRLSALLIDKDLVRISMLDEPSKEQERMLSSSSLLIRARTLSILKGFEKDTPRKNRVIEFLVRADIVSKLKLDLGGADLRGVTIQGAKLKGVTLKGADFRYSCLKEVDFSCSNLREVNFQKATLDNVILEHSNLIEADFTRANLKDVDLKNALYNDDTKGLDNSREEKMCWIGPEADLKGVGCSDKCLKEKGHPGLDSASKAAKNGVNLRGVDLSGIDLRGSDLSYAQLDGVNLTKANLSRHLDTKKQCLLIQASLVDAKLKGANLSHVALGQADMTKADLRRAILEDANLGMANLSEAILNGANLKEANLWGAQVSDTQLELAKLCKTNIPKNSSLNKDKDCPS